MPNVVEYIMHFPQELDWLKLLFQKSTYPLHEDIIRSNIIQILIGTVLIF